MKVITSRGHISLTRSCLRLPDRKDGNADVAQVIQRENNRRNGPPERHQQRPFRDQVAVIARVDEIHKQHCQGLSKDGVPEEANRNNTKKSSKKNCFRRGGNHQSPQRWFVQFRTFGLVYRTTNFAPYRLLFRVCITRLLNIL
jgi:hypothetical protein